MTLPKPHLPVLLEEVLTALAVNPDGIYVDGTFGRGGHSLAILNRLGPHGKLFCLDKDPQAIAYAQDLLQDPRVQCLHSCFTQLDAIARTYHIEGKINGILLDLGVSSPQLDEASRGFSFMQEGPLDMRMDPTRGESAQSWLSTASEAAIAQVLKIYGEEPFAKKIARKIVQTRQEAPLTSTLALAKLVASCKVVKKRGHHPATQTFQAIRLFINQELQAVDKILKIAPALLTPGGRLALISFHSLEDRKVKRFFRAQSKVELPEGVALPEAMLAPPLNWVVKRQRASAEEIACNPRARSATLRVAQKNP